MFDGLGDDGGVGEYGVMTLEVGHLVDASSTLKCGVENILNVMKSSGSICYVFRRHRSTTVHSAVTLHDTLPIPLQFDHRQKCKGMCDGYKYFGLESAIKVRGLLCGWVVDDFDSFWTWWDIQDGSLLQRTTYSKFEFSLRCEPASKYVYQAYVLG